MTTLSIDTMTLIAACKLLLFLFVTITLLILFTKNKPWMYVLLLTITLPFFYALFSWDARRMLWGNSGDELFILAFFQRVLSGEYFADFYYAGLPPFYPPLYFWLTGTFAKFFVTTSVGAAKLGVVLTLAAWFVVPYVVQKIFWEKIKNATSTLFDSWWWFSFPLIYLLMLEFDSIILKPYEAFTAMLSVLWLGLFASHISSERWKTWHVFAFGISGGALFLTYYFWWFMIIPVLILLASRERQKQLKRLAAVGAIFLLVSLAYVAPLLRSLWKYGMENWQAVFFVHEDLNTFLPWTHFNLVSLLAIAGLIGLIFSLSEKFMRANLMLLGACFLYQFVSIALLINGGKPLQASKPFYFLGTATLACGATYLIRLLGERAKERVPLKSMQGVGAVALLMVLPLFPFGRFIEDGGIQKQMEENRKPVAQTLLAEKLKTSVPDFSDRVWLSSGIPELANFLALDLALAHNPHFSHPASMYSKRFQTVQNLSKAKDAQEFQTILSGLTPKVSALLLYHDTAKDAYPLYFWRDNYPNGGIDAVIEIADNLISNEFWELRSQHENWEMYIIREEIR